MSKNLLNKLVGIFFVCATLLACKKDPPPPESLGQWTKKADFPGVGLAAGIGAATNNKGYIGFGVNDDLIQLDNYFYEYDPTANTWTKKADFPGSGRPFGSFACNNKIYIVRAGSDEKETWEYNPADNRWTRKASFPGSTDFYIGVIFSIGNKGYMGLGIDTLGGTTSTKQFWQYDAVVDTWTKKADYPGKGKANFFQFGTDDKGYVGYIGISAIFGGSENDFWEYNPSNNLWTKKSDYPGHKSDYQATSFAISGKGYVALPSSSPTAIYKEVWQYDPSSDKWVPKTSFPGAFRNIPVTFTIGNKAYLGTGTSFNYASPFFKDFWEFQL
jgi:N-acetylneuraminic acid mutarotase